MFSEMATNPDFAQKNGSMTVGPVQTASAVSTPFFVQNPLMSPFCASAADIGSQNPLRELSRSPEGLLKASDSSGVAIAASSTATAMNLISTVPGSRLIQPKSPSLMNGIQKILKPTEKQLMGAFMRPAKTTFDKIQSAGNAGLMSVMAPVSPGVLPPRPSTPQLATPVFVVSPSLLQHNFNGTPEPSSSQSLNDEGKNSCLDKTTPKTQPRTQVVKMSPATMIRKSREPKDTPNRPRKSVSPNKPQKPETNNAHGNVLVVSRAGNTVANGMSPPYKTVADSIKRATQKFTKLGSVPEPTLAQSGTDPAPLELTQKTFQESSIRSTSTPDSVSARGERSNSVKRKEPDSSSKPCAAQPQMRSILAHPFHVHGLQSSEDEPDLICHDSPFVPIPSPPNLVAQHEVSNWKKARLLPDNNAQQQQLNGPIQSPDTVDDSPASHPSPKQQASSEAENQSEDAKKPKRPRKPRAQKGSAVRPSRPRKLKNGPAPATTKSIPVTMELRPKETAEQRVDRLRRLAQRWDTIDDEHLQWLIATKSVGQLKMVRWLRLVDRAFARAESAKNFEKMERLRDSKIHVIMDLEKLQAPNEPKTTHFLHTQEVEKKDDLVHKFRSGEELTQKDIDWLTNFYKQLCSLEASLPKLGATVGQKSAQSSESEPFGVLGPSSSSSADSQEAVVNVPSAEEFTTCRPTAKRKSAEPDGNSIELQAIHSAHQFVRKFPDSTKALIEVGPDDMAQAVLLLIQQPNAKTVQVKKSVKPPADSCFKSKEESMTAATALLDRLVSKYLCIPPYPIYVRYPVSPMRLEHKIADVELFHDLSKWTFNQDVRGWETIQFVESEATKEVEKPIEHVEAATTSRPTMNIPGSSLPAPSVAKFSQQIASRQPLDLTGMANDPVSSRQWLSWECRHLTQQYFEANACIAGQEDWLKETVARMTSAGLPEATCVLAYRFGDLSKEATKKVKTSTSYVNKAVKTGEQVRDILESYKKKRPMTRRKAKAIKLDA